ncbi:MAG: dethiobiotin synthase [Vulcanimicrobiaceae bacterium]
MYRYFVTGTDTDVGKTRVVAALARAMVSAGRTPTVVKIVQTGVREGEPGDAARAGALAGCQSVELARFSAPADPYNAALAQGAHPPAASQLAARIESIDGPLVAEGSGGLMVPINEREHLGDVAAAAGLETVVVVGLRPGCINHALLTAEACAGLGLPLTGAVLVERWHPLPRAYRDDVVRALQGKMKILGIVPFAEDEAASVMSAARIFDGSF